MVEDHSDSYSFRLTARVLLYAPSHRQDNTYHGLCYTSREALAGTRNSSMGPLHEGSIRRPIEPWANALTTELHLAPSFLIGQNPELATLNISLLLRLSPCVRVYCKNQIGVHVCVWNNANCSTSIPCCDDKTCSVCWNCSGYTQCTGTRLLFISSTCTHSCREHTGSE